MLGRADRQDIHHPRIAYPQLCKVQAALFSDNEWRESENHGFLWFTSRHCSASPPANQQRYPTIDRLDWKCIPVGDEIIFHFVRRTAPSLGLISLRNDSKPFLCNDRWLKEISWQDLRACCGGNSNERDFQIVPPIDDNVGWINASKANEKKTAEYEGNGDLGQRFIRLHRVESIRSAGWRSVAWLDKWRMGKYLRNAIIASPYANKYSVESIRFSSRDPFDRGVSRRQQVEISWHQQLARGSAFSDLLQ